MRAVDADELIHELDKDGIKEYGAVSVFGVPIIEDCVPVVWCRDCKYAHMTYDGECKYCDKMKELADGESIPLYLPGNWFCADGEKNASE